jgi:glyoxylase-like metal-dependent hydrolase (beta-lactamase superfamily II)
MEIIEGLWQVGGEGLTSGEDAAVYLVRFGGEAAIIDAGCGGGHSRLIDNISEALQPGTKIPYLLLTHCHYDHTGGAAAIRDHYGCRIAAHALDAVYLEEGNSEVTAATWYGAGMPGLPVDEIFDQSLQAFAIGNGRLTAHHCPGHTPGSVVYTTEMHGQSVLFGQDVHGPLHPSFLSNDADYRRSLEYLLDLKADILCEGHFGVFRGKGQVEKFIRQYL